MLAILLACVLSFSSLEETLPAYVSESLPTGKLYWRPASSVRAEQVKGELPRLLGIVETKLGRELASPFVTVVVPHFGELRRIAAALGAPRISDATRGLAFPGLGVILVRDDPGDSGSRGDPFAATLAHELSHLVIHRRRPASLPRWLDEGVAVWASGGGVPAGEEAEFSLLARLSSIYRLDSLNASLECGQPSRSYAYCQSYLLAEYLVELGGRRTLAGLLDRLESGEAFPDAFEAEYRFTLAQLEGRFRRWAAERYSIWFAIASALSPWTILSVLAVVLLAVGVLRRRARAPLPDDEPGDGDDRGEVDDPGDDPPPEEESPGASDAPPRPTVAQGDGSALPKAS